MSEYVIIRYYHCRKSKIQAQDVTMTEVAPPDVKRRRLSTANTSPQGIRRLTDLPSGILAHAASFLAAPSKALFAIALDENSAVTINERSSAIVGNQWDILDFGQIEEKLAKNLSDLDIGRVLQCVDAVNQLKRLKLTNCTNITGAGLEPLRGSVVIEQIDLSLVDNHNRDLEIETPISLNHVLPILESMIESNDCELKHLQFPSVWRKEPSTDSEFHAFIEWYNGSWLFSCYECNADIPSEGYEWIETDTGDDDYGILLFTCYGCLKHYCYGCDDGAGKDMLHLCDTCKRNYCIGCSEMTECHGCRNYICNDCCKYECAKCNEEFCSKCVEAGEYINTCEFCNTRYCLECNDNNDERAPEIYTFDRCDVKCCNDCLLQKLRQRQQDCTELYKSLEHEQLREENDQLKVEVEELKRQIEELKELKVENEALRSKLKLEDEGS